MLACRELTVCLAGHRVLRGVSLTVNPGELTALVGPNGAGKTTLLRTWAGLLAYRGSVTLQGEELGQINRRSLARRIAYLAQEHPVHWPLTAGDVVKLGRLPHRRWGGWSAGDDEAVAAALQATDSAEFVHRRMDELSEGERSRVLLARALAVNAPLLLADEPAAALDPYHQLHMMELLQAQAALGRSTVMVLHDLSLAARFSQRLIMMREGRVLADGPPEQILTPRLLAETYGVSAWLARHEGRLVVQAWERLR